MKDAPYQLPRFQEALKAHSKAISSGTYWRYMNGLLPAFGALLVERPELAQALAEDALDRATQPVEPEPETQERPAQ
jgi:hypothetical protein